ncbi:hypothetical protein GH714_043164 [Hevea brasiliensis]|uniref:Pentacotripeptide-repeat region of PRORP domain-containing protein n=1 Tax=Hevea brasiliensis TaxID=3981 RepID=A0A6A6K2T4_HEVBR|nr:hypothetical protein GH714_043164 [Hevea brasiliensis]
MADNSQKMSYHAGEAKGQAQEKASNMVDRASNAAQSAKESVQEVHSFVVFFFLINNRNFDKQKLELNSVVINHELVLKVLKSLESSPDPARRFFDWVLERDSERLSSKAYNLMLGITGVNGSVEEFWALVETMKKKGYEKIGLRVSRIVRNQVWEEDVEQQIKDLNVAFSSNLVKIVLENLAMEPMKALNFLGGSRRMGCLSMMKAVIMQWRGFWEGKIVLTGFGRVIRIFGNDYVLTDSMLNAVLKSLTSVGRFGECNKVLKEMKEGGFVASGNLQSKIAFRLSSAGNNDKVSEFVDHMEASGSNLDYRAWASLIEGHCASGDLEGASDCFQNMIEKEGVSNAGYAFESLDGFTDALNLLDLMKNHGFPPFVDPFIKYVSKFGTGDDAIAFMKATTSKMFPSTSVVLRLFKAFFKAGRHVEAQDFLSKCPRYVRNHADVLNLFCSMKGGKNTASAVMAV